MLLQLLPLFFICLLLGNFGLIIACAMRGPKLRGACYVALWANGLFLLLLVGLYSFLLYRSPNAEQTRSLLFIGPAACSPWLVAFLAFAAIYRWRMKTPPAPPPIQQ